MRRLSSLSRWPSTAASRGGGLFDVEVVEERPGLCVLRISGKKAVETFADESGGHRWQRVPPTEKRGRVHTSTITVAVLSEPTETQVVIRDSDLDVQTCRGSGAGGQHRNKRDTAVQMRHIPTGVVVRCESERSQHSNRETALAVLRARVWEMREAQRTGAIAEDRRRQVGSGMRGDKRRTIRTQDDQVNDHVSGKSWRYKDYVRGNW